MTNIRTLAIASAFLATTLLFHSKFTGDRETTVSVTPPSVSPPVQHASKHSCSHSTCDHANSAPVVSRRVISSREQAVWRSAEIGEIADLGFRIGTVEQGRVVSRHSFEDGRTSVSLNLPTGHDLHIVFRGDEWEGRALSKDGSNGYKLFGNGQTIQIEEIEHEALICAVVGEAGIESAGLPVPGAIDETANEAPLPEPEEITVPTLNSLLGANGVIYLDFDGETVSGTQWNSSYTGGSPIVAAEANLTEADIERVWSGMAEDFRPFNVNVTTDRTVFESYPVNRRAILIFTPTIEWYSTAGNVGGVAYVDIFGSSSFDYPGWVFTAALFNDASNCHEAGTHEAGHILGLRHDGTSSTGYYSGHGNWAPIMGTSYSKDVSQWSKGEYTGANNFEDDLAIITKSYNGLGYLGDEHGNTPGGATPMTESGLDFIAATGLIETNTDVDVFSFQTSGGPVSISANNAAVDPNLDIRMRLLNSVGTQVAIADSLASLDASIATTLTFGLYYLEITGTGTGNPTTGYSDYASLGGYTVSGSAPRVTELAAQILSPSFAQVSLTEGTGLYLDGLTSGATPQWEVLASPSGGTVSLSSPNTDSTRATFSQPGLYRLRLSVTAGPDVESDEIEIAIEPAAATPTFSAVAPSIDLGGDRIIYNDRTTMAPVVTDDGLPSPLTYEWQVLSGNGQLSNPSISNPELTFATASTTALRLTTSDGDHRTYREVALTANFYSSVLIAENASAKAIVSTSATFSSAWKTAGYNDSAWRQGTLGAGYDVTNGNEARRIFTPLLGSLDLGTTMPGTYGGALLRTQFVVSDPAEILSLTLRMKFDDGFIAYLNGTEVARMNIPSGSPAWNTLASNARTDEDALSAVSFPIDVSGLIVAGTNVLAIHGMNEYVVSSKGNKADTSFLLLPSLEGILTNIPDSPFTTSVSSVSDPALRGATADADGDGRNNLYEHASGTDLNAPDSDYPMLTPAAPNNITITLPANRPTDARYVLESNEFLSGQWTEIARCDGNGEWQGTLPISKSSAPQSREFIEFTVPPSTRGFFRLRFELLSP